MAKIAIKSEKITPFGSISPIMEQFSSLLSSTIDSTLGLRCKLYGYQYSEIIRWIFIRPFLAMTMPEQVHHCSSGLTKPFAYERLFLWRLMHRGCHHSSDLSPLASSDTSHMQCRHDSQSGRIVTDCKLDGVRSLQFLAVNARFTRGAV